MAQELAPPGRQEDRRDHECATLKLDRGTRVFRSTQFTACGEAEGRLAARRNSNFMKEGKKMKPSTENEVAGKVHEVKGKVKEKGGQLTNNPDLEAEGQDEKIGGKVQKKIGQVEKVLGK